MLREIEERLYERCDRGVEAVHESCPQRPNKMLIEIQTIEGGQKMSSLGGPTTKKTPKTLSNPNVPNLTYVNVAKKTKKKTL